MKLSSLWFLLLSSLSLLIMPSCVPVDPYYDSYGSSSGTIYRSYPSYGSNYYSPGYSGYSGGYYGGGYRYSTCRTCGYNPCRCSSHSRSYSSARDSHDHNNNKKPSNGHGDITLLRGNDGDHSNRPQGSHSKEWYQKRGYDLKDYKYKDEAGHIHNKKKK